MAQVTRQRVRIQRIESLEEARPWVLRAFGAYVRGSVGQAVTVDYRKILTHMIRHREDYPLEFVNADTGNDGRLVGFVLNEMANVHVIEPVKEKRAKAVTLLDQLTGRNGHG